jgi:hypothetical protein
MWPFLRDPCLLPSPCKPCDTKCIPRGFDNVISAFQRSFGAQNVLHATGWFIVAIECISAHLWTTETALTTCFGYTSHHHVSLFERCERDSVVGTETCYRTEGPTFEPRWEQDIFSSLYLSRPALGPTQPPLQGVPGPFMAVKRPGWRTSRATGTLPLCASSGMLGDDLYLYTLRQLVMPNFVLLLEQDAHTQNI